MKEADLDGIHLGAGRPKGVLTLVCMDREIKRDVVRALTVGVVVVETDEKGLMNAEQWNAVTKEEKV